MLFAGGNNSEAQVSVYPLSFCDRSGKDRRGLQWWAKDRSHWPTLVASHSLLASY